MSNNPPNINPTGTVFSNVKVHRPGPQGHNFTSKAWDNMMKIVGQYIRADYIVEYKETMHYGEKVASCSCKPPLFPDATPE